MKNKKKSANKEYAERMRLERVQKKLNDFKKKESKWTKIEKEDGFL